MEIIETLEQIKILQLGTKLYLPTECRIDWWYYAGINPRSDKSIMLISAGDVNELKGMYYANKNKPFYLNYEDACNVLLENALENVDKVKRIFLKQDKGTR